jgi:hypothetical protein
MNENQKLSDILENLTLVHGQIDWGLFAAEVIASLIAALVASLLYRFFYERRGTGSQVHRAFPLLAISITTLFIGVQVSLPLSLGLLGSLSIIRFRTPIKEPEEVGFIMLVIASSILAATHNFHFMVILYAIAIVTLFLVRGAAGWSRLRRDGLLVLTFPRESAAKIASDVEGVLDECTSRHVLETSTTSGDTTTMQLAFSGLRGKGGPAALQSRLESVIGKTSSISLYLDRPGGIR